jgi:putative transcriptional regulator
MTKAGDSILRGLGDAVEFAKGNKTRTRVHAVVIPDRVDVKAIRRRTGMSQSQFADFYGFKLTAVQAWEQGRRRPERTARILLAIIEKNPSVVHDTLAG